MKKKILIFTVITIIVISVMPFVSHAVVHDMTEGQTVTVKAGEYQLTNLNYGVHEILNEQDYSDLESNVNQSFIIPNMKLKHNGAEISFIYSHYFNFDMNGTVANYYETQFTYTLGAIASNYTWRNGYVTIEGETTNFDENIIEQRGFTEPAYIDKADITLVITEDTATHYLGYEWLIHCTDYLEVNNIFAECDGSTCPATDADMNNICDDCGMPLTMSLRSTLYDYAVNYTDTYVSNEEQYLYRIIVQDNENKYSVYLSTTPAVYDSTTNELTFTDGKQTFVTQQTDGTNKGDGWSNLSTVSNALTMRGNIVYANYDIENFFPIPLWEEMDSLTQGEMTKFQPKMGGMITILTLCGVGCLALLTVLKLFGKRSLISRP